jgi:acetyl esterase
LNELDPQVTALLEQFKAQASQHPVPTSPLSQKEEIFAFREGMNGGVALFGGPAETVGRTVELDIPSATGGVPARLYVPSVKGVSPSKPPVLVYFHGGGFVAGGLESHDRLVRALANRSQCLVMSVAYRLAPENPFPAANDDAWTAIKWVADFASELGGDARRLAVGGDSAGGLLAAWVAQKAAKTGPRLRLQVLLYPNLDATTSRPSWRRFGSGAYLISHARMVKLLDAYLPGEIDREDPNVSPLFATDFKGIAPALIVTADHDPLCDEGEEYAQKLSVAGIAVIHKRWPGMVHGFASMAGVLDAGRQLIDETAAVLRQALE